jgi:anti-sigma regulatory factor (Ser/Thr protein kinase)
MPPSDPQAQTPESRVFEARISALPMTAVFAHDFCDRHGQARDFALRLTLVLEELFSNTVQHGHGGDCEAPVRITLHQVDGGVAVRYEDQAPPFDSVAAARLRAATPEPLPLQRRAGGLGLRLAIGMARSASYLRDADRNRIELTLTTGP